MLFTTRYALKEKVFNVSVLYLVYCCVVLCCVVLCIINTGPDQCFIFLPQTNCRMCISTKRFVSLEEVSRHNTRDDCWVVISNKVYDVTSWLPRHPGGDMLILNVAGRDCTDEFKIFHLKPSFKQLKPFLLGELEPAQYREQSPLSKDIDILMDDLRLRGAFNPDRMFGYLFICNC